MYHRISPRILTALVALCLCASQASAYNVVAVSNGGSIKGTRTRPRTSPRTMHSAAIRWLRRSSLSAAMARSRTLW